MFNHETFLLLCINTIIIVIVMCILFRMQDNKTTKYIKKFEKKISQLIQISNDKYSNINPQILPDNKPDNIINNEQHLINKSDDDSYVDPINDK